MKIGAIFDWDGVVIDSRRQHELSWERLAAEELLSLPDGHFMKGFGMKNARIIPEILQWTKDPEEIQRLSLRKEKIYRAILREDGIDPLPGAHKLLEQLASAKIQCVIGSSTERKNILLTLDMLGLSHLFSGIVSADDVTHGKPHPDVFLKAAKQLGLPPSRCVVFEDAYHGIAAARAGGMRCVAVTTTHPRAKLEAADIVVDSLDELAIEDLSKLIANAE